MPVDEPLSKNDVAAWIRLDEAMGLNYKVVERLWDKETYEEFDSMHPFMKEIHVSDFGGLQIYREFDLGKTFVLTQPGDYTGMISQSKGEVLPFSLTSYYVLSAGRLLTDEDEIRSAVLGATGVKLEKMAGYMDTYNRGANRFEIMRDIGASDEWAGLDPVARGVYVDYDAQPSEEEERKFRQKKRIKRI